MRLPRLQSPTSTTNPRHDFETNALGTFNLLEATRMASPDAFFQFASTNKVYGKMEGVGVINNNGRYEYEDRPEGISEEMPLDFHSPYGCSKGCADQYVRDYHRIYGLRTAVLRQSCIYGTRQFGVEDQGWVAWFIIASILRRPITIYGDGCQIRDLLWIDDLVKAYSKVCQKAEQTAGKIYNVGGGPENTLSIAELVDFLRAEDLLKGDLLQDDWRPGDQKVYVSNIQKIQSDCGWCPETSVQNGLKKLTAWASQNRALLSQIVFVRRRTGKGHFTARCWVLTAGCVVEPPSRFMIATDSEIVE